MRDLRTRLAALGTQQTAPTRGERAPVAAPTACYVRETRAPLAAFEGLAQVRLEQLCRMDPAFGQQCEATPDVRRFLFLDTETTGLGMGAGTVAFLLGLGWIEDDAFVVRQILMRDYPEEPLLLAQYASLLPRFEAVVSYNGKSFDLPLLESRLTMHRMREAAAHRPHLDLLYPTRRVWRMRLQDCTLGNIERRILRCGRVDDLPGALVPERFFSYLKTGDFSLLEDVLHHNLLDIQTLGRLLGHLARVFDQPEQQDFLEDIFSTGRALSRAGEEEAARRCFAAAGQGAALAPQAHALLAHSHRREGAYEQAEEVYRLMAERGEGGIAPYVELAKLAEHKRRDLRAALAHTEAAMARANLRASLGRPEPEEALAALHLRRARLLRRLASKEKR